MNTNNQSPQPEQGEKQSGVRHFFIFFGVAVAILVLIKLLIDNLMN